MQPAYRKGLFAKNEMEFVRLSFQHAFILPVVSYSNGQVSISNKKLKRRKTMTIKMIYRNGKNYSIDFIEISDDEAEQWVTYDFEKRLSEAPDEEKSQICKRTPQEIADEFNRQEERFNKDEMRKHAKTVRTVKDKDGNSINSLDLTPDKDTLSPLEMFLKNEKSKQLQDAKELLTPILPQPKLEGLK